MDICSHLIDVDLFEPHVDTIIIEIDNGYCHFVDVYYENVPYFCSFCFYMGHVATSCYNSTCNQNELKDMDKDYKTVNNPGRPKNRKKYRPN